MSEYVQIEFLVIYFKWLIDGKNGRFVNDLMSEQYESSLFFVCLYSRSNLSFLLE